MSFDTRTIRLTSPPVRVYIPYKGIRLNDKMTVLFHVSVTRLEHMSFFFPPAQHDTPFSG